MEGLQLGAYISGTRRKLEKVPLEKLATEVECKMNYAFTLKTVGGDRFLVTRSYVLSKAHLNFLLSFFHEK